MRSNRRTVTILPNRSTSNRIFSITRVFTVYLYYHLSDILIDNIQRAVRNFVPWFYIFINNTIINNTGINRNHYNNNVLIVLFTL